MKKILVVFVIFLTFSVYSQRGYKDSNRIGISAGLTQMNLFTDNFSLTPENGWIGGFSVRGNYYNNWQMSFGMFFTDSNFSVPALGVNGVKELSYKLSAVQIYLLPSYVFVENHINVEFGPVLQVNGKLGLDKSRENDILVDQPTLIAKDIIDVTKINANFYVGLNAGVKNFRARLGYQYGLTNFFGNLKNNDKVKLTGDKFKANLGLISAQITIYL
uniref:outer membrane beta-barrel protein n=1 Tax=Flavobacterium sp. TaxID=239 RepID=UPI00404AFD93